MTNPVWVSDFPKQITFFEIQSDLDSEALVENVLEIDAFIMSHNISHITMTWKQKYLHFISGAKNKTITHFYDSEKLVMCWQKQTAVHFMTFQDSQILFTCFVPLKNTSSEDEGQVHFVALGIFLERWSTRAWRRSKEVKGQKDQVDHN